MKHTLFNIARESIQGPAMRVAMDNRSPVRQVQVFLCGAANWFSGTISHDHLPPSQKEATGSGRITVKTLERSEYRPYVCAEWNDEYQI